MGSHTARTVREGVLMALAAAALVTAGKARGSPDGSAVPASSASSEAEASQQTGTSSAPSGPKENELEAIVVRGVALKYRPEDQTSATGLALPLIDTPQAITVLTSNMLDVLDAQSVYGATDLIPGVNRDGL